MSMKTHKPRTAKPTAVLSDDDLLQHLRATNLWDSISLTDETYTYYSTRLFGNANIGRLDLCNLQVPGQVAGDEAFVIMNWYTRTAMENSRELDQYAANTYATLVVGDRPIWCAPLVNLGLGRSRLRNTVPRWPAVLVSRQAFNVNIESFNGCHDPLRVPANARIAREVGDGRLWIHLEGVRIPTELWWENYGGGVDEAELKQLNARWVRVLARVLRLLTSDRSQAVDTAEHIARWLSSGADDDSPDELRAQLTALADAIREGKWRPEKEGKPEGTP